MDKAVLTLPVEVEQPYHLRLEQVEPHNLEEQEEQVPHLPVLRAVGHLSSVEMVELVQILVLLHLAVYPEEEVALLSQPVVVEQEVMDK